MSQDRKPRMQSTYYSKKRVNPKHLWHSVLGSAVLWSAAIGHASPASAAPFTCDGTLYISQAAATGDPTQLNDLVTTVNPFTFNPRGGAATEYNGMGFRVQDGFIYGVDPEIANDPTTEGIFRIDDTGVAVSLGVPAGLPAGVRYIAGDFSTNTGNYFIYGGGQLVEIDVTTTPPVVISTRTIQLPGGGVPGLADIAFNPVDGNFYGFDALSDRIVFFNPTAASPVTVSSVPQGTGTPNVTGGANQIGAAFFDAAGTFFGYQNNGNLYSVNLATGVFTLIGNPPQVGQNDGAGCPIAPIIEKTVSPAAVAAGSTVTYTYRITNLTDFTLSNLTFTDTMDSGRIFTGVTSNPLGGSVSGIGTSTLTINNFTIPSRTVTNLQVQVQIPATVPVPSTLFNQAIVSGPGIGSNISSRSDFPSTPERPDGTPVSVTAASADLSTVKTGVATATAGNNVVYTIVVTNNGPNDAANTVISDVIASGATFVAASNGGTFNAATGIITWPGVTIPANTNTTRTVTVTLPTAGVYTNTTSSASDTPDPNPNNNSDSATTTVASGAADVQTTKTGATSLPAPGQITYIVTTSNLDAANTATNVAIADQIAAGATFVTASDGGTFNGGTRTVTWPGVNIPASSSVTRTVTVSLPAAGSYTNTSSNTSDNDPTPGNNNGTAANAQVTTTVPPFGTADVQTTKTGLTSLPAPGQVIYSVSTTNNDAINAATNVVISDAIAPGASFVTASNNGVFNPQTRTVTWPAVSVGPGQTVTRNVTVNLPAAGSYTNTSSNTSDNDPNPANNNGSDPNAQVTTVVPTEPDLTITKSQTGSYVTGSAANYVLRVTNVGAGATNGSVVTVTDTLPAGLTPTNVFTAPGWTCNAAGQTITCTRSDVLASGASYPDINFQVTVTAASGTTLINTSSITDGSGGETNFNNNSDPETIQVIGATDPDLTITKTASGNFTAGGTGTYTLTVTNVGPGPTTAATSVRVSDNLPAGVAVSGTPSGTGWNCTVVGQTVSCDRNDVLASGASYPPLTIPVRITAAPGANVTNTALVTGGGDPNPTNSGGQVTTNVGGLTTPLGIAKQAGQTVDNGDGTFTVPLTIVVQNFGGVSLSNVQVQENLANTFSGVSAFSVPSPPTVTGALTGANLNFNGISDLNLLTGTQTLPAGGRATIAFNVNVTPGTATGPFDNLVMGSGVLPNNVLALDMSVNGLNPDFNGNGNPGDDTGSTPISLSGSTGANFRLVKRITNVTRNGASLSGVNFSSFVDDPNDANDNAAGWSNLSPVGVPVLGGDNVVQSDDEVEYTVYFLSDGTQAATNARVCDLIPQQTTFIANSFGTSSGISVLQSGTTTAQTNAADGDSGQFFSPLTPVDSVIPPCTTGTNNPNGAVFVNLGTVPNSGTESAGFVRFRVRVN